ncbi:MAG: response regulator [Anaerolineae bacterium]
MEKIQALLADDHAVVRAGLRNALSTLNELEIVEEVGDGPSLRAALARWRPDLLLIDVTMPDFEPIEAVREIRRCYPEMKILVISAYDDDVYVQGLLRAGVDGYHLKDQPLDDLRLAVQRVLQGEKWVSGSLVDKLIAPPAREPALPELTDRQRDILGLLKEGLDNRGIAERLGLSVKTVENHLTRLYRHLDVQSRLEALAYAIDHPQLLGEREVAVGLEAPSASPQERIDLLLVDDNGRYRRQLRRALRKVCPQAVIHEAATIAEALQLTAQFVPRLALVDVVLNDGEDGIRCTRRIKAQTPQTRVVLISAYPDRQFHRLGLEAGAAAFLDKKDLDAEALQQIVEDVVSRGGRAS